MSREQFLTKVAATWPGSTVVEVATILHEGWEMDNYVALVQTESSEFLATTDHGSIVQCGPDVLAQAERRHEAATASIRRLLHIAIRTDGTRPDPAPGAVPAS
jgi:hypothetical protein